jgi:hypothetical protein
MKAAIAVAALIAAAASIAGGYYYKAEREKAHAAIARECIGQGGHYHESIFRHRPICK